MKRTLHQTMQKISRQRGFSLIELLVGIVISLFVVSAASYIFLNTRNAERATNEAASLDETAQYAMTVIGRNVQNARFYPAISSEYTTLTNVIQSYVNLKGTVVAGVTTTFTAYDHGIFGCEGKWFDHVKHECKAWANTAYKADTIVIAYYTNDNLQPNDSTESKPLDIGQRADCTRSDSANDPINTNRVNTVTTALTPFRPLFVSNAFTARPFTTLGSGDVAVTNTLSLTCSGNGYVAKDASFPETGSQPLIGGLLDLQFTYGTALSTTSTTAERYYNATEISALPALVVENTSTGGTKTLSSWGLVKTVKVCILAKTLNNRVSAQTSVARSYMDCSDATVTIPKSDGSIYKRYVQTFGIRNNLNLGAKVPG